jgi:drug/metabolite transporter (DMT)-like permease
LSLRVALFIAVVVLAGAAGDICVAHTMKKIGHIPRFTPAVLFPALWRAFRIGWMWVGIALMAVAFFFLLALLSWADASLVIPATALSYVASAFGARILLHEKVTPARWMGLVLVCAGAALLSIS